MGLAEPSRVPRTMNMPLLLTFFSLSDGSLPASHMLEAPPLSYSAAINTMVSNPNRAGDGGYLKQLSGVVGENEERHQKGAESLRMRLCWCRRVEVAERPKEDQDPERGWKAKHSEHDLCQRGRGRRKSGGRSAVAM